MSNSVYKDFLTCPEMAMAKLSGTWQEEQSDALLIGSYVHAAMEGALDQFKDEHPELFTTKGKLYAKYENADLMVETLRNDEFIMFLMEGHKEHIITAEFAGTVWKAKLDVYNPDKGFISDIKTVKSIRDKCWDKQYGYVSFVEAYGYIRQMALYAELERISSKRDEWLETLIVAVTKEDPPDKEVIVFDAPRLQRELDEIKENMPWILQVRSGKIPPTRCETCKYCRATKKITNVTHYGQLLA